MPPGRDDEEQPLIGIHKTSSIRREDPLAPPTSTANSSPDPGTRITRAHVLLLLVAILYGSLDVSIRAIYALPDPPSASTLSTIRGWLAVAGFLPLFWMRPRNHHSTTNRRHLWRAAAELAVWNCGTQGLVNVGLLYVPSARAAFLTQLSVVLTPCLAAASGLPVHFRMWRACALALAGLICMSHHQPQQAFEESSTQWMLGWGDFLCLGGALSWSTYMFRLSTLGGQFDEIQLQAIKTFLLAILYSLWCGLELIVTRGAALWLGWTSVAAWAILAYSALGPGTVADVLQQKGQSTVSATVSNIILSLEPVFTAIIARLLLAETTTVMENVGGGLILTAAIVATVGVA